MDLVSSYKDRYFDHCKIFKDLKYKENYGCFSSSYCPQNRKLFKLVKPLLSKYYPGSYALNFIKTLEKYKKVNYKRQKLFSYNYASLSEKEYYNLKQLYWETNAFVKINKIKFYFKHCDDYCRYECDEPWKRTLIDYSDFFGKDRCIEIDIERRDTLEDHVKKCFECINKLKISRDYDSRYPSLT